MKKTDTKVKPEHLPISVPLTESEKESLRQEMKEAAEAMRKMRKYRPVPLVMDAFNS